MYTSGVNIFKGTLDYFLYTTVLSFQLVHIKTYKYYSKGNQTTDTTLQEVQCHKIVTFTLTQDNPLYILKLSAGHLQRTWLTWCVNRVTTPSHFSDGELVQKILIFR